MKIIQLTKGKCAMVDDSDYEELSKYKWHYSGGYARRRESLTRKHIWMHREIMKPPSNMLVDHVDRNPLNNKRDNLRLATSQQNKRNTKSKGYSYYRATGKWNAYVYVDYKKIWLGTYDSEDEAAKARQEAELKYYGEFAQKRA